jgi:hypothetical protein
VNTVTTLGATFSTIGAKLVITPGCVAAVSCTAGEEAVVEKHSIAPIDNLKNLKIPLCITFSPFRGIERSTVDGPFLQIRLATKMGMVAAATLRLVEEYVRLCR